MDHAQKIEGNIKLAEFEGYVNTGRVHPFDPTLGNTFRHPNKAGERWGARFAYHYSFDDLKSIMDKILDLGGEINIHYGDIKTITIFHVKIGTAFESKNTDFHTAVWNSCLQFVEWYNIDPFVSVNHPPKITKEV